MTYSRGLLIGRFQPLHFGHIYLIHESLKSIQTLIIGVGSAQKKQIHSDENPYSYALRKKMLLSMIQNEGLSSRIESVVPLIDVPNDSVWCTHVLKKVGSIDVVVTNNDWVSGIFNSVQISTLSVPFFEREKYEGRKIRELMSRSTDIDLYIPSYVLKLLTPAPANDKVRI